jgi:hypothetical protein
MLLPAGGECTEEDAAYPSCRGVQQKTCSVVCPSAKISGQACTALHAKALSWVRGLAVMHTMLLEVEAALPS